MERNMTIEAFMEEWNDSSDRILVHTSGTTGKPKPMWVEKQRMEASARITCNFLGIREGDRALLCLPLDYIAGKMMAVRSLVRGLRLKVVEPCGHPLSADNLTDEEAQLDFVAMVPMQVYNSLQVPLERRRLMNIRHLIIGGGAVDDVLAHELRSFPHAVWSTYGMTETLSHIALRRLNGGEACEWYTAFPSVQLSATAEGCLVVDAPLVCAERLVTNDVVVFNPSRPDQFRVLGRRDLVICSGGIKIQAEEVERQLRPYMRVPYIISKAADSKFGEVVALLMEPCDVEAVRQLCNEHLPRYWQPRIIRVVPKILLTETGKPRRDIRCYPVG